MRSRGPALCLAHPARRGYDGADAAPRLHRRGEVAPRGVGVTRVAIEGEDWLVDGRRLYEGRRYREWPIAGLLLNSRMANGLFDDLNPLTRSLWAYPDTGVWDPDRNTRELIAAMPAWRVHGLAAITVNLQGASPLGYYRGSRAPMVLERVQRTHPRATQREVWAGLPGTDSQPWDSSGFDPEGSLRPAWADRAARLIEAADAAGIVVILGLFYFGQDERLRDEAAVLRAVESTCDWVLARGYTNAIVEINNECDVPRYEHAILTPARIHELIARAKRITRGGRRLLVGTSFACEMLPTDAVVAASDFVLLHGNGIHYPDEIASRVDQVRALSTWRPMPVVYNEDDHFDFGRPWNNFTGALSRRAGWGFFDPGPAAGGSSCFGNYREGFQNPPIDWSIGPPRKRAFFQFLREVTGSAEPAR
jgi:hypothetical protein